VTGKKMTPVFPERNFHPYRVLYYSGIATARGNRFAIRDIFELEKSPDIAVNFSLSLASLDSSDIVVLPEGKKNALQDLKKSEWLGILQKFMDKGGKVLAVGSAWDKMPDHANLTRVPAKSSLVDGVLRAAKK
jgi:putative intracellular protease/amidase